MSPIARRLQQSAAHANGSLYITPSSGSYTLGDTITVTVRENSGTEAVNAAQVNLSYTDNTLDYTSTNVSGGAFTLVLSNTGGGGTTSLSVGKLPPSVSGDQLIATVTFQASAAGQATINFASGSSVLAEDDANNVAAIQTGATFTIV